MASENIKDTSGFLFYAINEGGPRRLKEIPEKTAGFTGIGSW